MFNHLTDWAVRSPSFSAMVRFPARHWLSVSTMVLALFVGLEQSANAQEEQLPKPESLSTEQLQNEIIRVRKEVEQHRNSPNAPAEWKERLKLEAAIEASQFKTPEEANLLQTRIGELSSTDAVREWENQIYWLERRRNELQAHAGVRLFQARHAELAKHAPTTTPQLQALGFDLLNYPQIDGSTSAQPLVMLITCRCFAAPYAWERQGKSRDRERWLHFPGFEPEAELYEFTLKAQAGGAKGERLATIINRLLATTASTHDAYVNLIEGRSDVGLLARAPFSEELELARMKNVELEVTPCALDAFVFLVNIENPIRNLTTQQIRDIYSGKVRRWKDVGGPAGQITAYQREESSGSQQLMRSLVMKEVPIETPERFRRMPQLVAYGMIGPFLELTYNERGLGYSVYYYERLMSGSPRTRTIAIDGIEPNSDTIRERKYPYVSEVFVVTRKGLMAETPAAKWRAWLLSPEGQAVVRESGYVPLPARR